MPDLGIEKKKREDNFKKLKKTHYLPFPGAQLKPNTFPISPSPQSL